MNATKYVLKCFFEEEPAYYINVTNNIPNDFTYVHLTTSVDDATKFDSVEDAEGMFSVLDSSIFKIYPVCPICGNAYSGNPAISRKDNKTKICSRCGTNEALTVFIHNN